MGRCRRHPNHIIVGVCAYCLNNRLLALLKEDQENQKYGENHRESESDKYFTDSEYFLSSSVWPSPIYDSSKFFEKSRKSTTVLDDFRQLEAKSLHGMASSSYKYHAYSVSSSPCHLKPSSLNHFMSESNLKAHNENLDKSNTKDGKKKKKLWLHWPFLHWHLSSNEDCVQSHILKQQPKGRSNYTLLNKSLREVHDSLSKDDVSSLLASPNVSRQCAQSRQCSSPIITNLRGSNKIHGRRSGDRKNWYDNASYNGDGNVDMDGHNYIIGHVGSDDTSLDHMNKHADVRVKCNGHVRMDANGIYHIDGHVGMDANGRYLIDNCKGMNANVNGHVGVNANRINRRVHLNDNHGSYHINRHVDVNDNHGSYHMDRHTDVNGKNGRYGINRHVDMVRKRLQSPSSTRRDVSLDSTPRISNVSAYSPDVLTRRKSHFSRKDGQFNLCHRSPCSNGDCIYGHSPRKCEDKQTKRSLGADSYHGFTKEVIREPGISTHLEDDVNRKSPILAKLKPSKRLQPINLPNGRRAMMTMDCGADARVSPIPHSPHMHRCHTDDWPGCQHREYTNASKHDVRSSFSMDADGLRSPKMAALKLRFKQNLVLKTKHEQASKEAAKRGHSAARWRKALRKTFSPMLSLTRAKSLYPKNADQSNQEDDDEGGGGGGKTENEDEDERKRIDGKQSSQMGNGFGSFIMNRPPKRVMNNNLESQSKRSLVLSALERRGPPQNYTFLNKDYSAFSFYFSSRS